MAVRSSGWMESVVLSTSMLSSLFSLLVEACTCLMAPSTWGRLWEASVAPAGVSVEGRREEKGGGREKEEL